MKSKYLFCVLTILLVTGTAMALPFMIGELGRKITIIEEIPNLKKGSFPTSEIAGKYNAIEYPGVANRIWNLEHLYSNSSILSIVGDFEYAYDGYGNRMNSPADDRSIGEFVLGPALDEEGDFYLDNPRLKYDPDRFYDAFSEPASIILIGTCLIGLADFGRKKFQK